MNKDRELGVEEFISSLINEVHKQEISHSCATREEKARSTTADKGFTQVWQYKTHLVEQGVSN